MKVKRKIGIYLVLAVILISNFTSGIHTVYAGTGMLQDPYTVTQAIANNDKTVKSVTGYIVGVTVSGSNGNATYDLDSAFTMNTNIALADSPAETDKTKIIPVQLPSGAVRTALNLVNNPGNLGKKVILTGTLDLYFSVAGLKSVTAYQFVSGNKPPVITHNPVTNGNTADDLAVSAQVTDDSQVAEVKLFYRIKTTVDYKMMNMVFSNGQYQAVVPKAELSPAGIEYYIEATDGINTVTAPADKTSPFQVILSDVDTIPPVVTGLTPADASNTNVNLRPEISAQYTDVSGINLDTVKLFLDNTDITSLAVVSLPVISYIPTADLTAGTHTAKLEVSDSFGNKATATWIFSCGAATYNFYFGQLHAHTNFSDGQGTPDDAYTWARDMGKADFFAITDHSNSFDHDTVCTLSDGSQSIAWTNLKQTADKYNQDGKFVALAGYEMTWNGSSGGWGHINTFNTSGFLSRNSKINSTPVDLNMYYDELKKVPGSISQLNHPGVTFGDFSDFAFYSSDVNKVVNLIEVGNGEGPVHDTGYFPSYEDYSRALDKGWHLAPTNNQDNHKAGWVTANEARTVALATTLTRDSIYDAMRNLRVYATEDSNLRILYKVNGMIMGTSLSNPSNLDFSIQINDPDTTDSIRKAEIIADGGIVAASNTFTSNHADWNFSLPPQYSYYYVKVTETDGDIAVTSPIWAAQVSGMGISKLECAQNPVVTNTNAAVNATVFNNSGTDISNIKVEFYKNEIRTENKIGESSLSSIPTGGTGTASLDWTPSQVGTYSIYAVTVVNIGGLDKTFTRSINLVVKNKEDLVKVVIDAGHQNQYVSGDYKGKVTNLKSILAKKDMLVVENTGMITDEMLQDAKILIVTDPQSVDNPTYGLTKSLLSDAEVSSIKKFTDAGGTLMITSRADYNDAAIYNYQSSVQGNKVLEAIGSNLRFNDDEVIDNTSNGGQSYRLALDDFTSTKYNLTAGTNGYTYSAFSGCSVIPAGSTDTVDFLVKGHSTTETMDSDNQGDNIPVAKGDVNVLAAEVLPGGGKVIVSGTTLFSDFEINTDNLNANRIITDNVLNWLTEAPLKSIKDVRADTNGDGIPDNLGKKYTIEGRVTSQSIGLGTNNAFFDVIYVQDDTGGITVYGVSQKPIPLASKVKVTGKVDQYEGDTELQISNENTDVITTDTNPLLVPPMPLSTGDSMLETNEGLLVKVEGTVTKMTENSIYINDGTGEAQVYVNGYVGDGTTNPGMLGKWSNKIQVGYRVAAVGLASQDAEGHRIRVRNTGEIYVPKTMGDVNGDGLFTVVDYTYVRQYLINLKTELPGEFWRENADVDKDGRISDIDFNYMRQKLIFFIDKFPGES